MARFGCHGFDWWLATGYVTCDMKRDETSHVSFLSFLAKDCRETQETDTAQ